MQEKEGNQPPAEMHFDCHMRGGRIDKLESIVVTSTIGIERRQFWLGVPLTEWQRIGNQINAASVLTRAYFVCVFLAWTQSRILG